jgi:hypothetical protein
VLPEDSVRIPEGGTPAPRTPVIGLRWIETMQGTLRRPGEEPKAVQLRLDIASQDLAALMSQPEQAAKVTGTAVIEGVTEGSPIIAGGRHVPPLAEGGAGGHRQPSPLIRTPLPPGSD